tara:strand:+ start:386 stop:616 length:231 start_codon:yes stop_codon:yes gene_type:complete
MNRFIELLERKIDGCDALGGLEREKAVYQSVLKDYKKQLTLTDVVVTKGTLCEHDYQPDITCGVDITACTKCGDVI